MKPPQADRSKAAPSQDKPPLARKEGGGGCTSFTTFFAIDKEKRGLHLPNKKQPSLQKRERATASFQPDQRNGSLRIRSRGEKKKKKFSMRKRLRSDIPSFQSTPRSGEKKGGKGAKPSPLNRVDRKEKKKKKKVQ